MALARIRIFLCPSILYMGEGGGGGAVRNLNMSKMRHWLKCIEQDGRQQGGNGVCFFVFIADPIFVPKF